MECYFILLVGRRAQISKTGEYVWGDEILFLLERFEFRGSL